MKKVLGSLALAAVIATPAMAADMPVKVKAPPPPVCYDWSGIYLGAHTGYMWGDSQWDYITPPAHTVSPNIDQWIVGGHGGALYQFGCGPSGNFVFGIEASATATSLNEETVASIRFPGELSQANVDYFYTAGVRFGWAWDTWLFSVSGGWATGAIHTHQLIPPTFVRAFQDTVLHDGWYVGAAVEKVIHRGSLVDAIIGFEYKHVFLDTAGHCVTFSVLCPTPVADARNVDADLDLVQVRLTIKTHGYEIFYDPAVKAKY
jgi:opacity protein-like surface antigen